MAEIGLVASILTIVQIAEVVIGKAHEYGTSVKNAREDAAAIRSEVKDISSLLMKLRDVVEQAERSGSSLDQWPTLASIRLKGGHLDQSKSALDCLALELTSASGLAKWKERMLWPRKVRKLQQALEVVKKQKEFFQQALSIDQAAQVLMTGETVSNMARARDDAYNIKVLQWLSSTDPSVNHAKARQRHERTTGEWFLASEELQTWKTQDRSLLWLHGLAGSGKTILSQTHVLAYFYFDFNDREKQQVATLLRSIVMQLCTGRDSIPISVMAMYEQCKGMQQPDDRKLVANFPSLIEGLEHAYIVIDALDECIERRHLLDLLSQIVEHKSENLHILLTSREESDIGAILNTLITCRVCLRGTKVDEDIRLYVRNKLDKDHNLRCWSETVKGEIEDVLVEGAGGMFRWVYCQIEALNGCLTLSDLRQTLRELPKTLDETYERILSSIPERYTARVHAALQWLAVSERPMYLEEVAEAAVLEPYQCTPDAEAKFQNPEAILNICGSLVTETWDMYGRTELRFAHYSVKEYLLSPRIREGPSARFSVIEANAHRFVVNVCLSYLHLFDQPESLSTQVLSDHCLYEYIAKHWPDHFENASSHPDGRFTISLLESMFVTGPRAIYLNWLKVYDPDDPWRSSEQATAEDKVALSLYYASMLSLTEITSLLLEKGADPNRQGSVYGTALQAASKSRHETIVRLLLENGADPNLQGGEYGTALQAASRNGMETIVRLLLDKGADPNLQGGRYGTALQAASHSGHETIVRLLLDKGADPNLQGGFYGTALQAASERGHEPIVRLLLDKGADPNLQGGEYGTALQAASERGHEPIVRLLLDKGADPNLQGGEYGTALQAASSAGNGTIVRLLLDKGADPNLQGGKNGTALQAASRNGMETIVRLLLEKGADTNLQGGFYGLALQAASRSGHEPIVRLLLDKGADPNLQGGEYGTALQAASNSGHETIVRLLLDKGADPNLQGGEYGTALQAASSAGNGTIVRLLLDKGADPNLQGGEYGTALQAASSAGNGTIVRLLLDKGADPNLQGGRYGTALQAASYHGHEPIVLLFLENGADLNLQGGEGDTALQAASTLGYKHVVQLLLEKGADPTLQGGRNGSALQAALLFEHEEVAELLRAYGAVTPPSPRSSLAPSMVADEEWQQNE
ncbi:MAG: hypothetical protein M1816_005800 [Peltula sp. TS41687]|nr:MAG: hypothetical protein M1816_005800 [Peltula sp. TS41687]